LIDALASQFEEAQDAVDEARLILENKDREAAAFRAELAAADQEAEQLRDKLSDSARDIDRVENEMRARIDSRFAKNVGGTPEDWILSEAKNQAQLREQHTDATAKVRKLEKALDESRNELGRIKTQVEMCRNKRGDLQGQIDETNDEIAEYDKQITEVTTSPDPNAEADVLARRITELETALVEAQDEERRRSNEATSAETTYEEVLRTAEDAGVRFRATAERARHEVAAAGFAVEEEARKARLSVEEQLRIDQVVSEYRQEHHAAKQRVAELERELGGREVTGEDLVSKEKDLAGLRKDYDEGLERAGALRQEIKELAQKIQRAEQIRQDLEAKRRRHFIYQSLSYDLRGEHFQAYLLEEAFRDLVKGASDRLRGLSERYTLDYRDDSFLVLDHDNAGERRSADTLSGGETFLASLALALELSAQVQRAAGAVNLDSLFIDEGFGTLDSETLDTVAAAIESLPVGGRMVGIITHLRELTERLPVCIRVDKSADGSRIVTGC
jgi:exonuclease SbcC